MYGSLLFCYYSLTCFCSTDGLILRTKSLYLNELTLLSIMATLPCGKPRYVRKKTSIVYSFYLGFSLLHRKQFHELRKAKRAPHVMFHDDAKIKKPILFARFIFNRPAHAHCAIGLFRHGEHSTPKYWQIY